MPIALPPFANLSADPQREHFSDGLAEEIPDRVAQVQGVGVSARSAAFAVRSKQEDVRTIAATLGVTQVLEGGARPGCSTLATHPALVGTRPPPADRRRRGAGRDLGGDRRRPQSQARGLRTPALLRAHGRG
jgi:hypothetical protein